MIIDINDVYKSFKDQRVLDGVDAKFTNGKIYGIVGRNGSGKSVLFKCISGLMKVDSGEITVDKKIIGKDIDFVEDMGF